MHQRIGPKRILDATNKIRSYADVLAIAAVVPGSPVYVAKHEFAGQFFAGLLLRRLGVYFVHRYDVSSSQTDTQHLTTLARAGARWWCFRKVLSPAALA
jgi:1-acyl-sn-glycerol-3-phosphate acyltransferase